MLHIFNNSKLASVLKIRVKINWPYNLIKMSIEIDNRGQVNNVVNSYNVDMVGSEWLS